MENSFNPQSYVKQQGGYAALSQRGYVLSDFSNEPQSFQMQQNYGQFQPTNQNTLGKRQTYCVQNDYINNQGYAYNSQYKLQQDRSLISYLSNGQDLTMSVKKPFMRQYETQPTQHYQKDQQDSLHAKKFKPLQDESLQQSDTYVSLHELQKKFQTNEVSGRNQVNLYQEQTFNNQSCALSDGQVQNWNILCQTKAQEQMDLLQDTFIRYGENVQRGFSWIGDISQQVRLLQQQVPQNSTTFNSQISQGMLNHTIKPRVDCIQAQEVNNKDMQSGFPVHSNHYNKQQHLNKDPFSVQMSIVTVPSSFKQPCKPDKLFHPPFKVRIQIEYGQEVFFNCRVQAYILSEQQVKTFCSTQFDLKNYGEGFHNGALSKTFNENKEHTMVESDSQVNLTQVYRTVKDFEFSEMRFKVPSRMKKRWIVFTCSCPNDEAIFCVYRQPTVVVSRSIEQYNKALLILQDIQPKDGRSMRGWNKDNQNGQGILYNNQLQAQDNDVIKNRTQFREYINRTYNQVEGLGRKLTEVDLRALESHVGIHTQTYSPNYISGLNQQVASASIHTEDSVFKQNSQSSTTFYMAKEYNDQLLDDSIGSRQASCGSFDNPNGIKKFKRWWDECLKLLQNVAQVWKCKNPTIISGFDITADRATKLLEKSLPETFLIRISSTKPGCFIISRRAKDSNTELDIVKHALLHGTSLNAMTMENWIKNMQGASYLYDLSTMNIIPKQSIFQLNKNVQSQYFESLGGQERHF